MVKRQREAGIQIILKMMNKVIPNFSNYEVSEDGVVCRHTDAGHYPSGYVLKDKIDRYGYKIVTIVNDEGITKCVPVHTLVATTFISPRPNNMTVNHKDGCKLNNHYSNLEYCTNGDNTRHVAKMGLKPRGNKHHRTKLKDNQVFEARKRFKSGESIADISRSLNVSWSTIKFITIGRNWSWLK